MLNNFNCSYLVYIVCGYTYLRRGINGLANLVKSQLQMDPFSVGAISVMWETAGPAQSIVPGGKRFSTAV